MVLERIKHCKIYKKDNYNNKVRIKIPTSAKFLGVERQSCIKMYIIISINKSHEIYFFLCII